LAALLCRQKKFDYFEIACNHKPPTGSVVVEAFQVGQVFAKVIERLNDY